MKYLQNIDFDKVLCIMSFLLFMDVINTKNSVAAIIIVAHLAYRAFKKYLDSKTPVVIETDLKPLWNEINRIGLVSEEAKQKASNASLAVGVKYGR